MAIACNDHLHAQQKPSTATPYLQLSDLVQEGYKGWIKEVTVKEYDRAEKKNGQWQPISDAHQKTVYHFDKHGTLTHYEVFVADAEQDHYLGKIVYSRKGDTIKTESYDKKDILTWTMVLAGNDPLGYTSWTYDSANHLTEQNEYRLNDKFLVVGERTIFYDSTGKAEQEGNIKRTYVYEGSVQKVTAVISNPGNKEADTLITRNTTLKKDKKGNEIMTLRKEAGQPHYTLFFKSFIFYDE